MSGEHRCQHHHHHQEDGGPDYGHQRDPKSYNLDLEQFLPDMVKGMNWTSGETILDYGCGNGASGFQYFFPKVLETESKMYSVDVSPAKIEEAKKKNPHERITYAAGNILEEFPFPEMKFDKIFSVYCFEFVPGLGDAMKKLAGILKPKGYLAFTMHKTVFFNMVRGLGESEKWKPYLKDYTKRASELAFTDSGSNVNSFRTLLEEAGFEVHSIDIKDRSEHFPNIETVLSMLTGHIPFIENVPKEKLPELKEDVRTELTKAIGVPRDSKEITVTYQCIGALAQKKE